MRRCVKITVKGDIQGVGYRHFVQKHAESLALEGSIQNKDDGSICIFVCGSSDKVDDLIDFVYQGSKKSKVEDVLLEPLPGDKDFRGIFRVVGLNN